MRPSCSIAYAKSPSSFYIRSLDRFWRSHTTNSAPCDSFQPRRPETASDADCLIDCARKLWKRPCLPRRETSHCFTDDTLDVFLQVKVAYTNCFGPCEGCWQIRPDTF